MSAAMPATPGGLAQSSASSSASSVSPPLSSPAAATQAASLSAASAAAGPAGPAQTQGQVVSMQPMQISEQAQAQAAQLHAAVGAGAQPLAPSGAPLVPIHDLSSLPPAAQAYCTPLLHESFLRHARHQHAEVIAVLERLLAVAPGFVAGWTSKGVAHKALKDNVAAVQCFQRALALDPTDWAAHDQLGLIFKETELFEKAMEQYRLAIQYGPEDGPAKEHLAVVLTDYGTRLKLAGSTDKAVLSYNEALAVYPAYWPAHFNLGVVCSERREFELAMSHYQLAVARNPTYVEALCNIGVIFKNSGELRLSIEYYERALKANPNFAIANSNLAIACLSADTPVRTVEHGEAVRADKLHDGMRLRGQHGEAISIVRLRSGHSEQMIEVAHEAGSHTVTPNHLVTLRWEGEPTCVVDESRALITLSWCDRYTLLRESMSWPMPQCSDAHIAESMRGSAHAWLRAEQAAQRAFPLQQGDLFDVRADWLLQLQRDSAFMQCAGIPLVRTERAVDEQAAIAQLPFAQADVVYLLPYDAQSKQEQLGLLQLQRARKLLGVEGAVALAEHSPDSMAAVLASSQSRCVVAFGRAAHAKWRAHARQMPGVASAEEHIDALSGRAHLALTMRDGRQVRVLFAVDPRAAHRFHDLLAALAAAHDVPCSADKLHSLAAHSWSPLLGLRVVQGGAFVAVEVDSVQQRFVLADDTLTHNCTDLGTQVKNEQKLDEGIRLYKRALHHHSRYPAAWYNLGVAYAEKCRFDDSKVCYEMAVLFDPKCAEAYNNLGVIYKDRGNLDQAIHYYNAAMHANPKFSQTMNNLAVIYTMLGKLDEAHEFCSRAILTNPLYAEAHNNLGVLYRDEGRIAEALASYEACLRIDPLSRNAGQNRLLAMNSLSRPDGAGAGAVAARAEQGGGAGSTDAAMERADRERADMVWQAHRSWGQHFQALFDAERFTSWEYAHGLPDGAGAGAAAAASAAAASSSSSIPPAVSQRRPLRIGYLSADFFTHSVSYFIEAPLAHADPSRTHVTCYANVARRDKKTAHLQSLAHAWRPVHELSAKAVADLIRADRIDILVELTGHTAGNRLDVLALKPAPVQVTWIGYPNSTGLSAIDYRLSDSVVDPPHTTQQYSEEIIYASAAGGPFLCYTPPSEAPAVAPTPALAKGYVTFGSFNNLAKVNEQVLQAWCAILRRVPNSRMLIKCKPFASPTVCGKMWSRFGALGVESDRVDLVSLLPTTQEHLESYSQVDISVDTFPYAGTTTTCEALFCGVPVVTYQRVAQPNHAHNVGATLLSRIAGMEKLIATSAEEYVNIAVSLAQDIPALQRLRSSLRPSMLASPVCDGASFVARLTETYERMWERYVRGEKPVPSNHNKSNAS